MYKYAKNESFVGYGKASTEVYGSTGMLEVVTDTARIEKVACHKLLGSIIDEDLTYEVHVDEFCMQQYFRATRPFSPYRVVRLRVIGSWREFIFED